ncbi:MAG: galactose ABC transporter substrate-binding protein [Oscillospiraceae bacterium]|nr:galactose ABC transporter substrate-binding protein [Oscillospiraceae bacterium]MCI1990184.1 galactose ABC transporter substrate-binding protein [Oscillospiraceae bacterium]MCI2034859.1 galactose ABC transporter substrate-binding protein [Oscillospiraceae bacterium]
MKKAVALVLASLMMGAAATGCSSPGGTSSAAANNGTASAAQSAAESTVAASDVSVGVCIYKFDDTFMTGVRTNMQTQAKSLGVNLDIVDSQNKQPTQNEQVDTFITKGVSALAVNPVDRTAAESILKKAKDKNLPIVFLNREPEANVMKEYDKVWYVGAKAEQSGTQQGEMIADYFKKNKSADKNGDGTIQYVMIQGEPGHQDATLRTKYSIDAITAAGLKVEKLAADTAYWDKAKATDLMNNFITSKGVDKIEACLCNNDDMALGAIEALKAHGYNKGDKSKYIPVVGVDATAPGLQAMKEGSMLGTVLNDAENQGKAAVNIAAAAAEGKQITKDTAGYPVTDGKYVWIDYVKVTQDNYAKFMK